MSIYNPISANTIFHFTESLEIIISILENDFWPSYSIEDPISAIRPSTNSEFQIAFPMVCFCDIPLSQIRNHIKRYGSYAIGLSKDWARKNYINPVLYLNPKTAISRHIYNIVHFLHKEESDLNKVKMEIVHLISFIKPYRGKLWKSLTELEDNVIFYNEREWRYVPDLSKSKLPKLIDDNLSNKIEFNNEIIRISDISLKFSPRDIRYIITEKEDEIYELINKLDEYEEDKFTQKENKLLKTRIISMEQILEDF